MLADEGPSNKMEEDEDAHGEDEQFEGESESLSFASHKLSCQPCRQRKIRCDRKDPCTPCTRKGIACTFPAGFKARQKRQRALVSNSYEGKIDDISRKLDRLCQVVDTYGPSPSNSETWRSQPSSTARPSPSGASKVEEVSDSELEGEPALAAQAAFAADYIQKTLANNYVSTEVTSSMKELSRMIKTDRIKGREPQGKLLQPGQGNDDVKLPPMQLVMSCVQRLKESEQLMFFWSWDGESVGRLLEYILPVYSGDPSIAELIIVNASLFRLFGEVNHVETRLDLKADLIAQGKVCQTNLDIILSRLPFNLASNFDNVLALFHAAIHFLGQCKTMTAWKYVAACTQMCQTLGYHRDVALIPETAEQRTRRARLVWTIIVVDKSLSLRLGRPSTVRDSDFTLRRLNFEYDVSVMYYAAILPKWLDWALLQGRVFDDVFSPVALMQPESIRVSRARALATELQMVFDSMSPQEAQYLKQRRKALGDDMHDLLMRADKVSHLSTMALIYRAIPAGPRSGSTFCEECVDMAHQALDEHMSCIELMRRIEVNVVELYVEWAILSSPFVPYIVLFCRVFETRDPIHLEKLASVVEMLQLLPDGLPEAYTRQLKVFRLMYDVAHNFIMSNGNGQQQTGRRPSDVDFDMFFREAGILPSNGVPFGGIHSHRDDAHGTLISSSGQGFPGNMAPHMGDSGAELSSWFDQNHQMFRMLEDSF